MAGPLKTLYLALKASTFMAGVSLAFGEESIPAQEFPLPYVVMVPVGGPVSEPGYAMDGSVSPGKQPPLPDQYLDTATDDLWEKAETVRFYLWAAAEPTTADPIENADAMESLCTLVYSALRDQRAQQDASGNVYYGLAWKPTSEEWETAENAASRYGRALVLTVQVSVPRVPAASPTVQIQSTQFNPSTNNQPG